MQLSFHLDSVIILWKIPTLWLSDLHHQKVAGFQISPFHTVAIILKATLFDYHLHSKDFHSNITSNETTWSPHKVSCDLSRSLLQNLFFKWPNRLTAEKSKLKEARHWVDLGAKPCRFWVARGHQIKLSLTIGLNKKRIFFFSKRWKGPKKSLEGSSESRGCSLECSGSWGILGAFLAISWMTLMTTKEKAAKEVLAQAEAPPPLGQPEATKVFFFQS